MQLRVLRGRVGQSRVPCRLPGAVILEGSVGYTGTNRRDEVVAIQSSLNNVVAALGGPGTALAEDGIAGPKTQNAILRFQQHWVPYRDSKIEPDKATLHALNRAVGASVTAAVPVSVSAAHSVGAGPARNRAAPVVLTDDDKEAINAALVRLGRVRHFLLPAVYRAALGTARFMTRATAHARRLPAPGVSREDPDRLAFLLVAKHFKLHEKDPVHARAGTVRVETIVRRMCIALVNRVVDPFLGVAPGDDRIIALWRQPRREPNVDGYTWAGGAWDRHRMRGRLHGGEIPGKLSPDYADRIYLPPAFDRGNDNNRSHVLVHELAHFVGDMMGGGTVDDLGYVYEPRYLTNTSHQRLHNADAYATLVREVAFGTTAAIDGAGFRAPADIGKGPVVHTAEQPVFPPVALGTPDPYAYPSGGV